MDSVKAPNPTKTQLVSRVLAAVYILAAIVVALDLFIWRP